MNIISFVKTKCFNLDIIENKNLKEEFISILNSYFGDFKFESGTDDIVEYVNDQYLYNVDKVNRETIKKIIEKKLEDRRIDIIDWDKSSKKVEATNNDINYTIRYIYDSKRNIYSICSNLTTPVGVLHRYFGPTCRIDYDANNEYLEFNTTFLDSNDKLHTFRHRYLPQGKNLTLVSYEKTYDAFKLYDLESHIPDYDNKFKDIYYDGKFILSNKMEEESNYIYITDKLTNVPTNLTDKIISCNGLIVYKNTCNKMEFDGFITCYDASLANQIHRFKHTPLYVKENQLIENYKNRKTIEERVKKLIKR